MRVMVALEDRYFRTQSGVIYSSSVCDYAFWGRYLTVFDEVVVFARICESPERQLDRPQANGPNVSFYDLAYYIGPWQYLRQYRKLNVQAMQAVRKADAFILRVPGVIGGILWRQLMKNKIPYAVEVLSDPWDVYAPGSIGSFIRPVIRRIVARQLLEECRHAIAASYVTEYLIQKRYPPGGWSTHYSSIVLHDEDIADESIVVERMNRLKSKSKSNEPLRICYIGTMAELYKAPDILIKAFASCINKGMNLEMIMIGDGRFRAQLEQLTQQLGMAGRVQFPGALLKNEVFNELDKADLYILPTKGEGLPRTIIEAMARGLPCISTAVSGIPELLDAEDLVPPGNVKALAEKIKSVISDHKQLEKMCLRNLQTAKKYRADELKCRRKALYQKLKEKTEGWYSKQSQK